MGAELEAKLAEIRELGQKYKAGNTGSFSAARDLFQLLLSATVMRDGQAVILQEGPAQGDLMVVGRGGQPVRLTNGRYLRVMATMRLSPHEDHHRLKVLVSNFQYQVDPTFPSTKEVFRYDYIREPRVHADGTPEVHPLAHLNIHATPTVEEDVLPPKKPLARIHFPTARVSLEAVIRCLADQFKIETRQPTQIWRPMLSCSEKIFLAIAHQPTSGPDV